MGHLDRAALGRLTPVPSCAMARTGAALGPRCTVRALAATGRARRNRLITAAPAIGTGIWTTHFVAVLGFGVSGTGIRHDVPLTPVSLLVAMAVVCAGVFAVGHGPGRGRAPLLGGLTTGLGVAGVHYLGMAAVWSGCSSATCWNAATSPSASRCRPLTCPTNAFSARWSKGCGRCSGPAPGTRTPPRGGASRTRGTPVPPPPTAAGTPERSDRWSPNSPTSRTPRRPRRR